MITLSAISKERLVGVHPDLVRVVHRTAALALPVQDFMVVQGVRSKEDMCINFGKGRTEEQCVAKGVPAKYAIPEAAKVTWLRDPFLSNHGVKTDGYGHAVDLAPYPIDWKDTARFKALAFVMKSAAHIEGVPIVWGGDWRVGSKDYPHYELVKQETV